MSLKRTLTIGAAGGAVAAWFAAAATTGVHDRPLAVPAAASPIDKRGAELEIEVERLHERLRPNAAPRQPARNLFEFGKAVHAAVVPARPAALTEPVPAVPVAPPPSPVKLAGIAEDAGADGSPVRTAIISTAGQLFLVREGDLVASRYRVVRISADAAELVDVQTNSPLRLVLK